MAAMGRAADLDADLGRRHRVLRALGWQRSSNDAITHAIDDEHRGDDDFVRERTVGSRHSPPRDTSTIDSSNNGAGTVLGCPRESRELNFTDLAFFILAAR